MRSHYFRVFRERSYEQVRPYISLLHGWDLEVIDNQLHFYTLPSLDPVPYTVIKPLRGVIHLAVDEQHLRRPAPSFSEPQAQIEAIDFCIIKRSTVAMYQLRERLFFQRVRILFSFAVCHCLLPL